jgi:MFS family permease
LIAARLGQAIAGSLVFPNAIALLRDALPEGRRAAGFGLLGSAVGVAAAVGPALGGVLVGAFGWRAVFLVNIPVVAGAVALSLRSLPGGAPAKARGEAAAAHPRWDWAQPLRVPVFGAATAAVGLSNLAMYGTLLAVPVVLAGREGWSAADTGLALAMLSVAMIAVAPLGGRLADRHGNRLPAAGGLALLTVAAAMLAAMGAAPSAAGLAGALLLGGTGLGLAGAALQTAAIEAVQPRHAGVAAGLYSTGRYAGSIVAALLLAVLLEHGGGHASAFFAITAVAAAASALLALRLDGERAVPLSAEA